MNGFGKAIAGIGAVSLAGALGYYLYERNSERPKYRLVLKDGSFEVRQYPRLLVAETVTFGSRDEALDRGFRILADYIFANSRGGEMVSVAASALQDREKISMTAPVLQDAAGDDGWRTRFVMPAVYELDTLPPPPAAVSISEVPVRRLAAVRFSGRADDQAVASRESELRRWLSAHKLQSSGQVEYAFYNFPFVPPFLRHNEILIPLSRPN